MKQFLVGDYEVCCPSYVYLRMPVQHDVNTVAHLILAGQILAVSQATLRVARFPGGGSSTSGDGFKEQCWCYSRVTKVTTHSDYSSSASIIARSFGIHH